MLNSTRHARGAIAAGAGPRSAPRSAGWLGRAAPKPARPIKVTHTDAEWRRMLSPQGLYGVFAMKAPVGRPAGALLEEHGAGTSSQGDSTCRCIRRRPNWTAAPAGRASRRHLTKRSTKPSVTRRADRTRAGFLQRVAAAVSVMCETNRFPTVRACAAAWTTWRYEYMPERCSTSWSAGSSPELGQRRCAGAGVGNGRAASRFRCHSMQLLAAA